MLLPFLLSFSIYSEYFHITSFLLNSICGIISIYLLFILNKRTLFFSGFLIGIFWFYWISISFIYYGFSYLIPLGVLSIGLIYGGLFYFIGFFQNIFYRIFTIYSIAYIAPLGFNWFNLEIIFVNSYIENMNFLIILVFSFILLNKTLKFLPFLFLPFILYIPQDLNKNNLEDIKIKLIHTNISQDKKWQKDSGNISFKRVQKLLKQTIKEKYKIVVFPETSIETYLNRKPFMIKYLKEKSFQISIVVGSLTYQNNKFYNSNYIFENGEMKIAHKVVLVPIGEKIPLPKFLVDIINNIFFDGANDYSVADDVSDYTLQGIKFRNAICFEATTPIVYKNNPKYLIANSNNNWFTPSIQPTIQKMLLQYYSKKYKTIIFHSINSGDN
jgi:apolipoprotein N-acyltransferase